MSWQRVRGHDVQVEAFRRALRRGRLAHAFLFTGPPGVGKRLFAVELARALLCESPPPDRLLDACDRCPACVQVEAGTHPDFALAARPEDAHEFPIEQMREVCRGLSLKPARGRGKVVVVEGADDLNEESANCFLKTLEEPPPGAVLILIGSSPDRQLPTIVSRCQVVRFAPLPDDVVADLLQADGVDDAALRDRLVRLGRGSPGLARALADPELWSFRRRLLDGLTGPRGDAVTLGRDWMEFVEKAGKESAAQRERSRLVVRLLIDFLSDALAASQQGPTPRTGPDDSPALAALRQLGAEALLEALERCLEADEQIERRVQLVLAVEGLLDALARMLQTARGPRE
jgi:DNA polymerase-3 subunit delta'